MDGNLNFKDIIKNSILKLDAFAKISVFDVLICIFFTLLVGLFIFYIYKKTFAGVVYSHSFNVAIVMMCLITALIIMTISSNIVLSLGMVGALSIVRFRTALKDPMDVVFMFWAIAAGIASGAGIYPISIFGSVLIGIVLILLSKQKVELITYLLIINYDEQANDDVRQRLNKLKYKLKSKTVTNKKIELTVELRIKGDNTSFVNDISSLNGVNSAVLVNYNGEYAS